LIARMNSIALGGVARERACTPDLGCTGTVVARPVTGGDAYASAKIGEEQMRVPVADEELVVDKRPVVKEDVIISKPPVEERDTVEADLRKERVDVQKTGRVRVKDNDRNSNR
jgi:stress response protein YsnF